MVEFELSSLGCEGGEVMRRFIQLLIANLFWPLYRVGIVAFVVWTAVGSGWTMGESLLVYFFEEPQDER